VARRKLALVFLLLCIMVLLLSPWADAPSPSSAPVAVQTGELPKAEEPEQVKKVSRITVEVALEEREFYALSNMNDDFAFRHPEIEVELRRIAPEQAYDSYRRLSELEDAADVMLFRNEWVAEFASSGYLLPADAAFVGKALGEQFEALSGPLKWNNYLWGVPRDMDPYVLVWNVDMLHAWLGEDTVLPLTADQWIAASDASAATDIGDGVYWLALDALDPLALLAWLECVAGERSDGLWEFGGEAWSDTEQGKALGLLNEKRANVRFGREFGDTARALIEGRSMAGVMPYSEAVALVLRNGTKEEGGAKLSIDYETWKLPYVWPRGSSFVISSRTDSEEAANAWIADMTGEQAQLLHMEEQGKLPVYRSFYDADRRLSDLLPGRSGQAFPNQSPLLHGPGTVERLGRLGEMWNKFAKGELSLEGWREEWKRETEG